MKIRTSEMTELQLDWVVAKVSGTPIYRSGKTITRMDMDGQHYWEPSTNWEQGGEIIGREIDSLRKRSKAEELSLVYPNPNFKFKAEIFTDDDYFCGFGSTPLIAAMRCYVTSKLGDIVDIPEELL